MQPSPSSIDSMTLKEVNKTPSSCIRYKVENNESLKNAHNVGKLSSSIFIFVEEELSESENADIQFSLISGDTEAVEYVPETAPMKIDNVVSLSDIQHVSSIEKELDDILSTC